MDGGRERSPAKPEDVITSSATSDPTNSISYITSLTTLPEHPVKTVFVSRHRRYMGNNSHKYTGASIKRVGFTQLKQATCARGQDSRETWAWCT